jgi:uncharacterized membrane protein
MGGSTVSDSTDQGVVGVGLILAAYTDVGAADQALDALKQAKRDGVFAYDDAAVVVRDNDGKVSVEETGDMTTGKGAGIGALIGGVIGILGGPAGIALGAGAGAAIGGIAAHSDAGFDNETLAKIGGALPAGTSALAVTTSKDFVEAVRQEAGDDNVATAAEQIAAGIKSSLEAGQDTLVAMVLTEDGVAAEKIAASDDAVSVFGMAATEGAATAGGFVATDEGVAAGQVTAVAADDDSGSGDDSGSDDSGSGDDESDTSS